MAGSARPMRPYGVAPSGKPLRGIAPRLRGPTGATFFVVSPRKRALILRRELSACRQRASCGKIETRRVCTRCTRMYANVRISAASRKNRMNINGLTRGHLRPKRRQMSHMSANVRLSVVFIIADVHRPRPIVRDRHAITARSKPE